MSHSIWNANILYQLLSLAIVCYASYTTVSIIDPKKERFSHTFMNWGIGAAVIYTIGQWTMHVVSLLASNYLLAMDWDAIIIFIASSVMTYGGFQLFYHSGNVSHIIGRSDWLAVTLLSAASLLLHYRSLISAAVNHISIDYFMLAFSVLVSFASVYLSLLLLRSRFKLYKLFSGLALGISSMLVHRLSIAAVTIEYNQILTTDSLNEYFLLLAFILSMTTLLVLISNLTTWSSTRKYAMIDRRYKLLVENSMDTIALIKDGKWEYINPSGLRLFEADREEQLLGKSVFGVLHPQHAQEMGSWFGSGDNSDPDPARPIELQWITLRGKLLHSEMIRIQTDLSGEQIEQVIIRDISERKKNEELLINSEKLSIAGQLAAGIAHEIRNPLTSLKGFLQLIATGRVNSSNYYGIMKSELVRIETIVSELLMLSKPQVYEYACIDMRGLLEDTVQLLETQANLHNVRLEYRFTEQPVWVKGVENQLKQVIINVLNNAIESMTSGGRALISLSIEENEKATILIQDEGAGMPEEQLSKIGQPFYTTKDKGTGLGLMVSYKIIDNHNGTITAESEIGVGTTFTIRLPLQSPSVENLDMAMNKQA